MLFRGAGLTLLGLVSQARSIPTNEQRQDRGVVASPSYEPNPHKADAVKHAFQRSWDGYYKYAFPHDSLKPLSNTWDDDRNGWGASAVDALSTALVMENHEVIGQILQFIPTINFDNTTSEVSLFETTIRYLGGMLSAYDLLKGPLKKYALDTGAVNSLLSQAKHLADNLKIAFETPTGVPDNSLFFDPTPRIAGLEDNWLATIGTLVLEWTRLSDLTGDKVYGELTQKAEDYLFNPKPASAEPFPGMVGSRVFIKNATFVDAMGSWNGGTDSYYEYLIKMWVYDPKRFSKYRDQWIKAADSSIKYLASHPSSRPDLTFLSYYDGKTRFYQAGHLGCFDGGNFILGGLVLKEQKYIDFGLNLTAACRETYIHTKTGIGPELFAWEDGEAPRNTSNNPPVPKDQAEFYKKAGFYISLGQYVLRPEVIESYYYAYRATGNKKYQDWAWDAFLRVNATCAAGSGYSAISDVNQPRGGNFYDAQESFWFAEVMKYTYLIFAEDSEYQIKTTNNKWVYNTEAHPVKVADYEDGRGSSVG